MVLEAQSPTIKALWDAMLPTQHADQSFLFQHNHKGQWQGISYKDLYAHAQCVAGYLMERGLRQGDAVGILAQPNLRYHVLHMALQYLGVANVTLPPGISTEDLQQLAFKYDFRLMYVDTVAQFQAHGELRDLKAGLSMVIIGEDEVDGLEPEKIVTFDRVVTLGKVPWREQVTEMKARKAAVSHRTLYAVLVDESGKTTELKMEQWLWAVDAADKVLAMAKAKTLLCTLGPDRLLWRAFGFAAARRQCTWYVHAAKDGKAFGLPSIQPEVLLCNAQAYEQLYLEVPSLIDVADKGRKAIQAALALVRGKLNAEAQGQKDKFMNRVRYRFRNRKLYARIRSKLGGKLVQIHVDEGPADADAILLFAECGMGTS